MTYKITYPESPDFIKHLYPYMVVVDWFISRISGPRTSPEMEEQRNEMMRWVKASIPEDDWTSVFATVGGLTFNFKHQSHVMLFKLRFQ